MLVRCAMMLLALAGCRRTDPAPVVAVAPVVPKCVPKLLVAHQGTPKIDGAIDEPVWHSAAATEPFVSDEKKRVVPHTEARAAWDADALYLALYVADADLKSSDEVTVTLGDAGAVTVAPDGAARCRFGAQTDCANVVAKVERDGDVDAEGEEDEEWAVELRLPWRLVAPAGRPAELPVSFTRLDTLDGERIREVWSRRCGALRLE